MNYQAYVAEKARMKPHFDKYRQGPIDDLGISTPESYNLFAMSQARGSVPAGAAPLYTNPVASLYNQGNTRFLNAPASGDCASGCLPDAKPDPRVRIVKPMYDPYINSGGIPAPNANLGMY